MALVTIDQVTEALNLGDDTTHLSELEGYIDAVTDYVEAFTGTLPSAEYTETARFSGGEIITRHFPILSVTSIDATGTSYTEDITIGDGGFSILHDSVTSGEWTVTYEAGWATIPAALQMAALEDIRGLYQPGQIGPPSQFSGFGIEATDTGPTYRPVRMWPRVDAWLARTLGPGVA